MTKKDKDTWMLDEIKIEFNRYGENEGKYSGKIQFQNGHYENFTFRIRPDMAQDYINLIAKDIVHGADSLVKDLIKSLGLTPKEGE